MFKILFPRLKDRGTRRAFKNGRNDRLVNRGRVFANAPSAVERLQDVGNSFRSIREDSATYRARVGLDQQANAALSSMSLQKRISNVRREGTVTVKYTSTGNSVNKNATDKFALLGFPVIGAR